MGRAIDRDRFDASDFERFAERLERCLEVLRHLVGQAGFGLGPRTLGAELELFLVGPQGRPLPVNQKVLHETIDPRLTYELDRFNLECNLTPVALEGRPFAAVQAEVVEAVTEAERAAAAHGGRVAVVGILPTLELEDLQPGAMSDVPRYRALSASLHRHPIDPFRIRIDGEEPLETWCDDVTFEGANTSFQIHLRVAPAEFSRLYNAAQAATAPVLAVSGNAPLFLGHRLWEETRIALFKQSVDGRPIRGGHRLGPGRVTFGHGWIRGGAVELFEDLVRLYEPLLPVVAPEGPREQLARGKVPGLEELRLHNGTVWRWNRAVYDPEEGGHLRIEMRALPAGPTPVDMAANAAFLVGLTLALAPTAERWTRELPFEPAHRNLYRAARDGLGARLFWQTEAGRGLSEVPARELVRRLLPQARRGLERAGVDPAEAAGLLEVLGARVASGQTGAVWQRRTLERLEPRLGRRRALALLLERYMDRWAAGIPVHLWPVG